MRRRTVAVALLAVAAAGFAVSSGSNASSSVEAEVFRLVNGSRGSSVSFHSGLQAAARGHSQAMASRGGLSHSGAASRIRSAPPDPPEANGAPDDGYNGRYCENVGYVGGVPEGSVAQRIYDGWRNSSSHYRCMTSHDMTAGGVGVYFDGSRWWVTLDLIKDVTLPGSRNAAGAVTRRAPRPALPDAAPSPTAAPVAAAPIRPAATPSPEPTPASRLRRADVAAGPSRRAAARTGVGLPEILAGIGIASVSVFAYRRTNASNEREP